MNEHYQKWDEMAPRGMLTIGFGLTMLGEAIRSRGKGRGFLIWFIKGTIALIAINAGIAMFGESVKHRTLYELEVKKMQEEQAQAE